MIKVTTSQINLDKVKKKLEERLKPKLELEVGFFESATYKNGEKVAQVAYWNEYGTSMIPPRPFFRNAIKENSKEWLKLIQSTQLKTKDMGKTLAFVGDNASYDISDSITNLSSPANSEKTINGGWITLPNGKRFKVKGKGSDNPLIDTGIMVKSVTYIVK